MSQVMAKSLGHIAHELRRKLADSAIVRQIVADRETDNILVEVSDGMGFNITRKALDTFTIDEIMEMMKDAPLRPWSEVVKPLDRSTVFDA